SVFVCDTATYEIYTLSLHDALPISMEMLRSKLYELEVQKKHGDIAAKRKTMVSTGDRSAKIRTYNYPQGRVTEHRIGLTMYNLPAIMDGDIQEIIDALQFAEN